VSELKTGVPKNLERRLGGVFRLMTAQFLRLLAKFCSNKVPPPDEFSSRAFPRFSTVPPRGHSIRFPFTKFMKFYLSAKQFAPFTFFISHRSLPRVSRGRGRKIVWKEFAQGTGEIRTETEQSFPFVFGFVWCG